MGATRSASCQHPPNPQGWLRQARSARLDERDDPPEAVGPAGRRGIGQRVDGQRIVQIRMPDVFVRYGENEVAIDKRYTARCGKT